MKVNFSSNHLREVFADEEKYDAFRNLCFDLNHGNDVYEYDENGNGRKISKHEANQAIRKILMEVCELTEEDMKSKKRRSRMINKHADELFELIEQDIEFKVVTGLLADEFFDDYVEYRNIALGDDEEYWETDPEANFIVAEVSGDHHDLTMQHLSAGQPYRIHTKPYGVKVGKDIDMILLGRIDFTKLTDKIAEAYIAKIKEMTFTEFYAASAKLPNQSQFVQTGVLSASTKADFDELLEDVQMANGGAEVVIIGTKTALKALNNLTDVNWRAPSQKEDVAHMGRLGDYEGVALVEVPQRFAMNDVTNKLIPNDKLLIFARGQEKMIKVTDRGEIQIVERGENKADLADDFHTYEVQREFGVGTVLTQYFGQWNFQ